MTTVTDETELNQAIAAIDGTTVAGTYTIDIAGTITEGTDTAAGLPPDLYAINLQPGVSLVIDGGETGTLDGANAYRGFFVYAGDVTIQNLTIANAVAVGGAGDGGAGGGAGLGGGLFVTGRSSGNGGVVTLDNVAFAQDGASGGASSVALGTGGGGGGLGGAGGAGGTLGGGGGGGGIGSAATGGLSDGQWGQPGVVIGADGGGDGGGVVPGGGGRDGGGGGAGSGLAGSDVGAGAGGGVGGHIGATNAGGGGGFGGGGGGGLTGGEGGFGGGGGAGVGRGGNGGFGGGGGSIAFTPDGGAPGSGGFGAGAGASTGGGGGLGAGGDIFVQQGGILLIEGGMVAPGSVQGGAGSHGGGGGAAYGDGIFIQGTQAITLAPLAGQTLTIGGVIADQTGSAPAAASQGQGGLIVQGPGTVVLDVANTFVGGITIENGGAVDLAVAGAAGGGAVRFDGPNGTLRIEGAALPDGTTFANEIAGFNAGDTIDLAGLSYVSGATSATLAGGTLSVTNGATTNDLLVGATPFVVSQTSSDGNGGTDITNLPAAPLTTEAELNTAIRTADAITQAGTYTIEIAGTIFEGTDTSAGLPPDLYAINLHPGVSLVIDGGGSGVLDGGDLYRGFFVYAGDVSIENLTIAHAAALGGSATGGGGGGAGLGGGLFVAGTLNGSLGDPGATVTLDNVAFNDDLAIGGSGGSGFNAGGGGGLGGDSGTGNNGDAGGGGGGIGAAAFGGNPDGQSAQPGIVAGADGGGAGGEGPPGVGGSAGGGGGGATTDSGFTFYAGGGGGVGGLSGNGNAHGGAGGFGGGGGGASGENLSGTGGVGGFGGGGGAGSQGGDGGFGGGGAFGSGAGTTGGSGAGGFGAGGGSDQNGGPQGGGGGLGAGGDIFVQQGGVLLIEGGSLTSGSAQGGGAGGNGGVGAAYGDGVFIQGTQAVTLAPRAGETLTIGATIADQTGSDPTATSQGQGGLIVQGPGTVVLDGFNTFTGGTTIEDGGRLDLAAPLAAAGTGPITFSGSGDLLRLEAVALPDKFFTNAIRDFSGASTIDLAGLAYVPGETSAVLDATELVVSNGTLTDRLFLEGTFPTALHVSSDGTGGTDVTCFLRGTRIATPGGEMPVETLRRGDPVTTVSGATKPIVWIGRRRIDPRRHPHPGRVRPIRIRRDAFGAGVPHRDLLVSPDHAVFIDGALVCARRLINGATILQDAGDAPVEYFHLELESHDILLAEGLPAESYLDTGNRALFENAGLKLVLHPDLSGQARRVAESCALFVEADAAVYPIWRRLAARAAALGLPVGVPETTTDPALCVVAGGRAIGPLSYSAGRAVFLLPCAGPARLVSRAAAPAALRPWIKDRRRLGVCVGRILWRHGNAITEQPLDDPLLADGWWEVERDGPAPRRWTSGDAVLPAPVRAGPALLEVQYGAGIYGEPAEPRRRLAA